MDSFRQSQAFGTMTK